MKRKALVVASLATLFGIVTLTSIGLASILASANYPALHKAAIKEKAK